MAVKCCLRYPDAGGKLSRRNTLADLIDYLEEKTEMADHLAAVRAYRQQYGI